MGRTSLVAVGLLLAISPVPVSAQTKDPNHVYGADPGWEQFRTVAEQAVLGRLVDPESARITWLSGYRQGGFKPLLQARVHGYVACGIVNARNRMGGYAGATTFIVVVDYGRALFVDMDTRPGGSYDESCAKEIATGRFPQVPGPASTNTTASAVGAASAAGFTVRAMPEGAYVSAVEPGSAAASAGLSAGMVITSVNGIPLAGMGDAMIKVVAAAGAGATFTMVGGKAVTLRARQ